MPQAPDKALPAAQPALGTHNANVQCIESQRLFAGAQEVLIQHHGVVYRLKQTSLGKLILTK